MRAIDWKDCPDVERIPAKVSGAWLVVGTRIPADAVLDNAEDGYTAEIVANISPACRSNAPSASWPMRASEPIRRILFDEGVPIGVRILLAGYEVVSVAEALASAPS